MATVSVATVVATDAQAAGCAKPRTAFDQVYCSGNMFSQTDHELSAAYADLLKQLRPSQQDVLRKSQVAWTKTRDAQCSEEKQNGYYVNLDCAVEVTQQRLNFLKDRDRECKSSGCEGRKLGN
nr:lysozyme inhibitor LprI family protein [Bordetella sp. LUAb4]